MSSGSTVNPFEITKATDFTNDQIEHTWVDLPGARLADIVNGESTSMPRFLVGGKGGGRTHLMRHQSFSLQKLRARGRVFDQVLDSGYVGVYFRCGGLNSSRFQGKGQTEEIWSNLFAYYMDIWLAQMALSVVNDLLTESTGNISASGPERAANLIYDLFDVKPDLEGTKPTLESLQLALRELQREIDVVVNNSAMSRRLEVLIRTSPGTLVFGVPRAVSEAIPELQSIRFVYLLDEFENLSSNQQIYVNTLVREKRLPSTFVIGSRLFGIRSHATLSAGEENKIGSEFDQILLEDVYREAKYEQFCRSMVQRRLADGGLEVAREDLDGAFQSQPTATSVGSEWATSLVKGIDPLERPYFIKLRRKLLSFSAMSEPEIDSVVAAMSIPEFPLVEKYGLFYFYRGWAKGDSPGMELAVSAGRVGRALVGEGPSNRRLSSSFKSYAPDLAAQLARDCRVDLHYAGLKTFIDMSGFLPRNLLIVLKQVTRWAFFLGERPFTLTGEKISLRAQREGVRDASEWFYSDAKPLGDVGEYTHRGVSNLGSYLRSYRFSDKPVEINVSTVGLNRSEATRGAIDCIDSAVDHSLLIEIKDGHRTKNSESLLSKYQINPMLAPKFDLPLSRRGVLALSAGEVNAIFDPRMDVEQLRSARRRRLSSLNAPFKDLSEDDSSVYIQGDESDGSVPLW